MKEFPSPSLSLLKKSLRETWYWEMCQIFKIARGDFRRCSVDDWEDVLTEMWIILRQWNNMCKWKQDLYKGSPLYYKICLTEWNIDSKWILDFLDFTNFRLFKNFEKLLF